MADRFQSTPLAVLTPPPFAQRDHEEWSPQERVRLLDRLREVLRRAHYSRRTERAYRYWVERFIGHHGDRHPARMGADEIRSFLSISPWRTV